MKDNPCCCQTHERIIVADLVQGSKQKLQNAFFLPHSVRGDIRLLTPWHYLSHSSHQTGSHSDRTEHLIKDAVLCVHEYACVYKCVFVYLSERNALKRQLHDRSFHIWHVWHRCPHILPSRALSSRFSNGHFSQIDTAIIAGQGWLLRDEDLLSSLEPKRGNRQTEKTRQTGKSRKRGHKAGKRARRKREKYVV